MSEHYIQSQYLLKQITSDFFNEHSDTIRVKDPQYSDDMDDISIQSDTTESSLEQKLDDSNYFYLDSDKELSTIFDICDKETDVLQNYNVYICPYKMNRNSIFPFLQYFLIEQDGELNFPRFEFQCNTNIVSDEGESTPKQIYFQNECIKHLFKYATPEIAKNFDLDDSYKGFVQSTEDKTILYVVFDIENFQVKDSFIDSTIFEIINTHKVLDKQINKDVNTFFIKNPSLLTIKDSDDAIVPTPHVLYKCLNEEGKYKNELNNNDNEFMSLIDDTTSQPLLGDDNYLFVSKSFLESDISELKRYAVFHINPTYICKKLDLLTEPESSYSLGKAIPTIVDYFSTDKKEETKNEEEDEEDDEEDDEDDEEDDEEEDDEEDEEDDMKVISKLAENNNCIYYHQTVESKNHIFWMIKSPTHFIQI